MKHSLLTMIAAFGIAGGHAAFAASTDEKSGSPDDHLPRNIERLTYFGERPAWSPDGTKIAFMSKSFGDAFVLDVKTKQVRLLTHYPNPGYLRVQYLPNGDYLLIGARSFQDVQKTRYNDQEFWLLKADGRGQAIALNEKVSEGVAISRKAMKIAWAVSGRTSPDQFQRHESAIYTADVVYEDGQPKLANKKEVVRASAPDCSLEAQDFRDDDRELIYVCYRMSKVILGDVYGVDLETGAKTIYRKLENEYNEAEGIFPDGRYVLVESDREQLEPKGSKTLDIWKLRLEPNSTDFVRLTRFGDYPGYKASNPVVSPDGRSFAFQQGRFGDEAGVGYGIFLMKLE